MATDGDQLSILWVHAFSSTQESRHGGRHRRLQRDLEGKGINVFIAACRKSHLEPKRVLRKNKSVNDRTYWMPGFSSSNRLLSRFLNILVFSFSLVIIRRRKLAHIDLVVGSTPDPLAAWAAFLLSKKLSVPFVLEVRDVWPETLVKVQSIKPWHPYIILLSMLERRLYARARLVISNLPNLESYVRSFGSRAPFVHVPNYVDEKDIVVESIASSAQRPLRVIYAGTIGVANDLKTFLEAVKKLVEMGLGDRISVDIFGDGPQELAHIKKYERLPNIVFHRRLPRSQILDRLRDSDIGVICWRNIDLYRHGISANKVPDYLASGLPILMAYGYDHPLRQTGAGLIVAPENVSEMTAGLVHFIDMDKDDLARMKTASINLARTEYCFSGFENVLVGSLKSTLGISSDS